MNGSTTATRKRRMLITKEPFTAGMTVRHKYSGGEGTGVVAEHLQACNYSIVANVNALGWTANQILGHTSAPTAFYVNTHGDFDAGNPFFMSDRDEVGDPEYIYARFLTPQVLSVGESAVGTGTPPRNSGSPPVTIAFVDACLTGQVNEFAAGFLWPYWTENGWCVDQAEVGSAISTRPKSNAILYLLLRRKVRGTLVACHRSRRSRWK
jgi:hypothetical protein